MISAYQASAIAADIVKNLVRSPTWVRLPDPKIDATVNSRHVLIPPGERDWRVTFLVYEDCIRVISPGIWSYEDEFHHATTPEGARYLWRQLKKAGFKPEEVLGEEK